MSKNVLLVTPDSLSVSETFIQAHLDNLSGKLFHLYGCHLNFFFKDGMTLRDFYIGPNNSLPLVYKLLPYFWTFKLIQQNKTASSEMMLLKRYLIDNKIDVVLAEYGQTGAILAPMCSDLNIPLVVHFHGYDASKIEVIEDWLDRYQKMFRVAKSIVVVSQSMKQSLMNFGCEESKLIYSPYGPNSIFLSVQVSYFSNIIVSVGRFTPKKAPYLTILAFQKVLKQCPDLHLLFVGEGVLFETCHRMVKSLGLEDKIHLLGMMDHSEIPSLFERAFLYVQHSVTAYDGDSEGTPVSILEAMASGLPVVSTSHAGIADVVVNGETGLLVNEGDINAMADAIVRIAKDRTLAERMGRASRSRITSHFSMDNHIAILNNLLTD